MDVFLVPVGPARYELYCEAPIEPPPGRAVHAPATLWRRQVERFRQLLRAAEDERRLRERGEPVASRGIWRWLLRKLAESIAEQRLLWQLRGVSTARLIHPADVTETQALALAREAMQRDFEKHRRWLVIDALIVLLCLPLTVIPGPNVPSLYFTFRAIGHYFSMHGARRGLAAIAWRLDASVELTGVRQALQLDGVDRRARIDDLAAALGLDRLGAFVERAAS